MYRGPEAEKIKSMFSRVAEKYDRANDYLSFWVHHSWRKKLVEMSRARIGSSVLDCATGTGDLAFEFQSRVGHQGTVIGTDFCQEMLNGALEKERRNPKGVKFQIADTMNLPFENGSFDVVSISFGIRNVSDPQRALREMARVGKNKGYIMVLEFGQVDVPGFAQFYNFYSQKILPKLGGWITGDESAYRYLQSSSAHFPSGKNFEKMMMDTGLFSSVESKPLMGGIAFLYKGVIKDKYAV